MSLKDYKENPSKYKFRLTYRAYSFQLRYHSQSIVCHRHTILRRLKALSLVFLYTHGSSIPFIKPNSLTGTSNWMFQLFDACFNP